VGAGSLVVDLQDVAFIDCGVGLRSDGEVELATVELFGDVVNAALVDAGEAASRSVVVELDRVRFMSAAGVAVFCLGHHGRAGGVGFRLAGGPAVVRWILRVTGVTGVTGALEHYDPVAEALAPASPGRGSREGTQGEEGSGRLRAPRAAVRRAGPVSCRSSTAAGPAELIKGYLPVALHVARKV
jgi:anti-anti-sigma factor